MSIVVTRIMGALAVLASLIWDSSASAADRIVPHTVPAVRGDRVVRPAPHWVGADSGTPGSPRVADVAALIAKGVEVDGSGEVVLAAAAVAPAEGQKGTVDPLGAVEAALKTGNVESRQAGIRSLAEIKSARADKLLLSLLEDLKGGRLAPELGVEVLDAAEARGTEPFADLVKRILAGDGSPLAAHRFALKGGNVEAGRRIFFERADVACVRCHTADAAGGEVGPNLQGVARRNPPEYLLESVVLPNARIAPGFENVMIETTSGALVAGVLKSESAKEIVVNSPEEGPITLARSEIKSRQRGLSGMPEGMGQILSRQNLRDLLAYLTTLK